MTPPSYTELARDLAHKHVPMIYTEDEEDLADDIVKALQAMREETIEKCVKALCKGCELEWELRRDGVHYRQILMDKRANGEFVYREADKPCLALAIRGLK